MRKFLGALCMLLGVAMILGAGWLILENRAQETNAENSAALVLNQITEQLHTGTPDSYTPALAGNTAEIPTEAISMPASSDEPSQATTIPQATPVPAEMPTMRIDGNEYIGYLELPTISISLPVMKDWSYPQLRVSPCRYHGSAYDDTMVIMAHNYDRHFGRLQSLQVGDPVQFVDARGNVFRYVVAGHEQLGKYDVEEMIIGDWDMTLFSCTFGGRARNTVRLNRVHAYS